MASEPIRSTKIVAAPKDYSIPPAQQIRLLSLQASFDGSGGAADWLPAVQILDNNGNVLVTAADQAVKVTAGGSADVSWFPGVKVAAAASAAGSLSYAWGWRDFNSGDPKVTLGVGAHTFIPFLHATTTNAAVMSWRTIGGTNDALDLNADGIYTIMYSGSLTIATDYAFYLRASFSDQLQHSSINTNAAGGSTSPLKGVSTNQDYSTFNVSGGDTIRGFVQNNSGVNQSGNGFYLAAIYHGIPA